MIIKTLMAQRASQLARKYLDLDDFHPQTLPSPEASREYLLYAHIPFCESLCPFCSFNRVVFEPQLARTYFKALHSEVALYADSGYRFDSLYVGGGTPTIMPQELAEFIQHVKKLWNIKEVSVETNPNHLDPDTLKILEQAGIQRLSVGVQSFNNSLLSSIGRMKKYGSGEEILDLLKSARGIFHTLNIDLIFNLQDQTEEMLLQDLEIIKESLVDQVTYYPLMLSKSKQKQGRGKLDMHKEAHFYNTIVEQLTKTYEQKSVWCFSKQEGMIDEYILDHEQYAGTGAGSFGYMGGTMYSNTYSIQHYIDTLTQGAVPIVAKQSYSKKQRIRHDFLLKLLGQKLPLHEFKQTHGVFATLKLLPELTLFLILGVITIHKGTVQLTKRGDSYWIVLMRCLFSEAGDYREQRIIKDQA
ncbi:MAG: coproporphyrinogen III oxidase family protein [Spirochaetia bacterium]|jgi:coproporphyrinogen III oxidase-like Fe-S oxidoreductase|nr:coproporphyrinogen III oxidase family protein [Spirochaetia bacterium]